MRLPQRGDAAELETLFRLSLDILCIAHSDGYFKRVNPAFSATLGWTEQELLTAPFIEFVHPADVSATVQEVERQVRAGERVLHFENRYAHKDGSWRVLSWTSVPQPGGLMFATARDVTDLKEFEAKLNKLNAELESYTGHLEDKVRERTNELSKARLEAIDALARACEFRDDATGEHTRRVGSLSARIAAKLGEPPAFVSALELAAPLHDVGKIAIPDAILLKPGLLTEDEREVMREHTVIGSRVFSESASPILVLAKEIALGHHEKWDGSGYPYGLKGETIPLSARIVAVADVYDALTHERPYKSAWTHDQAIEEIRAQAGSHFDPRVVEAFEQVVGTGRVLREAA